MIRDRLTRFVSSAGRFAVAAVRSLLGVRAPWRAAAFPAMLVATALLALSAAGLEAQQMPGLDRPSGLAGQGMRPYWHVFAAYTIAIVLVIGWVWSIARRLRDVEERLGG